MGTRGDPGVDPVAVVDQPAEDTGESVGFDVGAALRSTWAELASLALVATLALLAVVGLAPSMVSAQSVIIDQGTPQDISLTAPTLPLDNMIDLGLGVFSMWSPILVVVGGFGIGWFFFRKTKKALPK